jgi:4-amino-4-deoxy-L-arabinose transferase-like glycosyltransferase
MKRNKKSYARLLGLGILALFFITRLYNLLAIPIFTDESIYVRWAEIFKGNSHQVFVSLTDGKQPLFIWVVSVFLRLAHDPLLAGRLASVLTGLMTMIGLYFLTKELFKDKKLALAVSLLYVLYPFSLLYDKLALYDSMLATFAVWSLYMEVLLAKRRSFGIMIASALIISGGLFTKSSAFFFLYLLPFSLLVFDFKTKSRNKDLLKWLGLALAASALSVACYSILKLSPNFHYIADKNNVFIYPFHEWIKHPFTYLLHNTRILCDFLIGYSTIPFLLLAVMAFFVGKEHMREKLLLLAWFVIPFASLAFFGKVIFPRYILFMTMPLLALAAYSAIFILRKVRPRYLAAIIVLILMLPILNENFFILSNFSKAPIPKEDRIQYIESFSSGVGVKQTVSFLRQTSQHQKIYIGTQGVFGLMPDSLQDYFNNDKNVEIKGLLVIGDTPPQEVLDAAKTMPTYFVLYAPCPLCGRADTAPKGWPVKQILQTKRLDGSFLTLYQVLPKVDAAESNHLD